MQCDVMGVMWQNLAGTLFTNTINLFGGITLCFLTSWRLSLLAFTTVGPIMAITENYARWSKTVNRLIQASLDLHI